MRLSFWSIFLTYHNQTIRQPLSTHFSLKIVSKRSAKELHFGNPKPLVLCYDVLIFVPLSLGVSVLDFRVTLHSSATLRFNSISLSSLCLCGKNAFGISAAAIREPSAATAPIQRHYGSHPPAKNVNSAASRERPANHFSGSIAQNANCAEVCDRGESFRANQKRRPSERRLLKVWFLPLLLLRRVRGQS